MPKLKELSLKNKAFIKNLIETNNITESAMRAYDCKNRSVASVLGNRTLRMPMVRAEFEKLMNEKQIDDDFMFQRLKEGMGAKVISNFRGDVVETEIPDHSAAYKWWEAAAKIKEYFPSERSVEDNINIDMQLENMSKEEIAGILKEFLVSLKEPKEDVPDEPNKK